MKKQNREQLIWGILLILFGTFLFVNQLFDINYGNLGLLFLPGLGAAFLTAGLIKRTPGFIIPGGILSGIGWGAFVTEGVLSGLNGDQTGGVFLVIFALGFVLITVLTAVVTTETHWWPLIPGGILALVGASILLGGVFMTALTLLGKFWPAILIIAGISIILKGMNRQNKMA